MAAKYYEFVCLPHTNVYMAVKYYEFVCLPHTNLYMAVKYYEFVCFQLSPCWSDPKFPIVTQLGWYLRGT